MRKRLSFCTRNSGFAFRLRLDPRPIHLTLRLRLQAAEPADHRYRKGRDMKKYLTAAALSLALALLPVQSAQTQGIPVIDTSQIAQVIATLQQQIKDYEEQIKQLATMQDQLTNMQQRLLAITGAREYRVFSTERLKRPPGRLPQT